MNNKQHIYLQVLKVQAFEPNLKLKPQNYNFTIDDNDQIDILKVLSQKRHTRILFGENLSNEKNQIFVILV